MVNFQTDLKEIVDEFLSKENNLGKLFKMARNYYTILAEITEVSDASDNPADDEITFLNSGKAISPKDAARCVLEFARTTKFLQGLYSAISEARKNFPGERIEILYAGCGPFAALAIPQCFRFNSSEISFTLIDIHQRSLDSAKRVFEKLEFEDYVCEFIKTDATLYRNENGKKFHVIITETMQKSLEKEPQATITLNLAKQLRENGFFIPQKISIKVCLANSAVEFDFESKNDFEFRDKDRIHLGTILELSAESKDICQPQTVEIPFEKVENMSLMLLTEITIFKNISLDDYDSSISYPTILKKLDVQKGRKLEFRYVIDEQPRFEYQYI